MAGIVVVFDFDFTILDCDSDYWVVDKFSATDLFNELLPTMPFNPLMNRMMLEIYSQGKTIEDIAQVLKRVPLHPRIVPAIKAAHSLGCDLRIVSDANLFFIDTILEHLEIKKCFTEISTNPGFIDDEGRLKVLPYHDFTKSSHGCTFCPLNMCKGKIMERIQNSVSEKRMIYVGDGLRDYCPVLKLRDTDYVMPRKDFPMWNFIRKDRLVKAQVHEWSNGQDFETVLHHLIHKISLDDHGKKLSPLPQPQPLPL